MSPPHVHNQRNTMARHLPLILILLTTLAFWRLVTTDFVLADDHVNIYENPHFENDAPGGLGFFWKNPYIQLYIPVTYTVWGFLVKLSFFAGWANELSEVPPLLFHGLNLLCHLAGVLLTYKILRLLFPSAPPFAAALGAALFAIHPLQVEAVAWATGLKDVLSGTFALAALLAYLLSSQTDRTSQARTKNYGFGLLLFVLSLLTKPSSASLPFLAALLAIGILHLPWRATLKSLLPWFGLAFACVALTRIVQPEQIAGTIPPLWLRPIIAADALLFYVRQFLFPYILSPQYGRSPDFFLESINLARGAALLFATLAAATGLWFFWKKARPETFRTVVIAAALSFFAFLPVLGFIPFGFQRYSTVADRYAYLPMLGPALLATWLFRQNRPRWILVGVTAIILLLAARTNFQVAHWQDTYAYLDNALKLRPDYQVIHSIRGILKTEEKQYDDAFAAFTEAQRLQPTNSDYPFNKGATRMLQERFEEALPFLRQAIELNDKKGEFHRHLGDALRKLGRHSEAIESYRKAIALPDPLSLAYNDLGISLMAQEQYDEAAENFQEAARLDPGNAGPWFNLALCHEQLAQPQDALRNLEHALTLEPGHAGALLAAGRIHQSLADDPLAARFYRRLLDHEPGNLEALYLHAWLLATSTDDNLRDGEQAIQITNNAIATHGKDIRLGDLLAAALAESGKFEEAVQLLDEILASLTNAPSPNEETLTKLQRHRDAYQRHQPWRGPE